MGIVQHRWAPSNKYCLTRPSVAGRDVVASSSASMSISRDSSSGTFRLLHLILGMTDTTKPANKHIETRSMPFRPFTNPLDSDNVALQQSFSHVPRYLFRLYAPKSAGKTDTLAVISPAAIQFPTTAKNIFAYVPEEAAEKLNDHLMWRCDTGCNLMSWTSSLPVAIQHGLRRHISDRQGLSEIFLLVIDTQKLGKNVFLPGS